MKLVALAVLALALAVGFVGAVLLVHDPRTKTVTVTAAAPEPGVSSDAKFLSATDNIDPLVAQERLRTASETCDVLREVGEKVLASVCRLNIEHGDAWWDTMPPRQLRAMSDALIRANQ
jgi:hypothetical protein